MRGELSIVSEGLRVGRAWLSSIYGSYETFWVEAMGLEPTNLLTASQALYQLSYAPGVRGHVISRSNRPFSTPVTQRSGGSSEHRGANA